MAVIIGNGVAAEAARAATTTIPIVFVSGDDPIKSDLVTSLNKPGGNVTGVTFLGGGQLGAKRVELLHELVPAGVLAVLTDPNFPGFEAELPNVVASGRSVGREMVVVKAAGEGELDRAFTMLVRAGARGLVVGGCPLFTSQRRQLVTLAARHAIPAIYDQGDYVADGGLISYAGSFTGAYRRAGVYAGKILKGAKPADLPVEQPTKFELVII